MWHLARNSSSKHTTVPRNFEFDEIRQAAESSKNYENGTYSALAKEVSLRFHVHHDERCDDRAKDRILLDEKVAPFFPFFPYSFRKSLALLVRKNRIYCWGWFCWTAPSLLRCRVLQSFWWCRERSHCSPSPRSLRLPASQRTCQIAWSTWRIGYGSKRAIVWCASLVFKLQLVSLRVKL